MAATLNGATRSVNGLEAVSHGFGRVGSVRAVGEFYGWRLALQGRERRSKLAAGPRFHRRGDTVRPNRIKQMWREGKFVTMGWLSVSHGFTAEVMARQGFDTLCVDMQHGLTDMNDVWPMLQAISQTETVPVVRVPWNDPATIM